MLFKRKEKYTLDMNRIPAHIAFIMDGNGRWAKKRKMPRTYGHHEGTKTIRNLALEAINKTKDNTGLKLVFAFIYGGRDEIVEATKAICEEYKEGKIDLDNITEDYFESHLMTKELPPVDLMIRSSGECRLSNFLLWQLSYAEFIFDEAYWPDFNAEKLHECIWKYQNRDRRYGGVKK